MMKKVFFLITILVLTVSCKNELVEKPENLIDKKIMIDILYDMSLLESIKYQYPYAVDSNAVNASKYIFKKYKIDSLQFAKSNLYYASQYSEYKEMFSEINDRIVAQKKVADSLVNIENKKKIKTIEK